MPNRIDSIRLSSCRGATNDVTIPIDAAKPVVLVFGENGTGKSTIIDALDMVCNSKCGSIDGRSSTSVAAHVPSLGSAARDFRAEISVSGKTWTTIFKGSKLSVSGPSPRPVAHILRRNQLLRLVEAAPADRYKEISCFVDVSPIEACEQTLKDSARNAGVQLQTEIRVKQEAEDALRDLWTSEGSPGGNKSGEMQWAKERTEIETTELEQQIQWLESAVSAIERAAVARDNYGNAMDDLFADVAKVEIAKHAVADAYGLSPNASVELVELLNRAHEYVRSRVDESVCPVCNQPVVPAELTDALEKRLGTLQEYRMLGEKLRDAEQAVANSSSVAKRDGAAFIAATRTLAEILLADEVKLAGVIGETSDGLTRFVSGILDEGGLPDVLALALVRDAEITRMRLHTALESAKRTLIQFGAVKQAYQRVINGDNLIRDADEVQKRLTSAFNTIHAERISYIQSVLDSVTGECQRLYKAIHPGESLQLDRLRLDEQYKGSLLQEATFEGASNIPPQAYFSDAHLDTLGFCFWLAIAKLSEPSNSIIVIDDVFTSVDAAHIRRIIDLLTVESNSFAQIIVATHYRAWLDTHKYQQTATAKAHVIELSRWTFERGISHHRSKLAIQDLEDKLASHPIDRQSLCSAAGVMLEQILDHLTLLYRSGVPRTRDGDYTLGDLLNATNKLTRKLVLRRSKRNATGERISPASEEELTVVEPFDALKAMAFIRNEVGCHFNARGAEITDGEVEEFAKFTLQFAHAIVCAGCGEVSRREKGTHFECQCGDLRMEPLVFQ